MEPGSITLSTPQDIATTSTPQFARMGLGTAAHASDILTILSTSTTDTSKGLDISHTGAITGTGYGGYFSKTGASTTNVGLYATATGATNNYAAIFENGDVGIGTTSPGATLDVRGGMAAGTNGTEFTVSTAGAVTGTSFSDGTLTITGGDITNAGAITASGTITGGTLTDGTFSTTAGAITGATGITSSGTITFSGLSGDTDDTILILNSSNQVATREIDSHVWGGALIDGSGTADYAAYWSDADTLTAEQYLSVSRGGTGVGTLTEGGILYGNGTSAVQAMAVLTNGQLLIGDGTGAPTVATLTGTANQITVTNGAGSITLSTPQDIATTSTPQFARMGLGTAAHASDILTINSTSTTDTSKGLNISHTGAITGTGYGGYFSKTGASTTNVGLYATASGATNNYAAIFEAGSVGIGTTEPTGKLNIVTGLSTTTSDIANQPFGSISFANASTSWTYPVMVGKSDNATGLGLIAGTNDTNSFADMTFSARENDNSDFTTLTSAAFSFQRYTTNLLTILRSGDVGIGNTVPATAFDDEATSLVKLRIGGEGTTAADAGQGVLQLRGFSNGADATVGTIEFLDGREDDSIAWIQSSRDTTTIGQGNLRFYTSAGAGALEERMRIDSSGNVGFGDTTPDYPLDVTGSAIAIKTDNTDYNQIRIIPNSTFDSLTANHFLGTGGGSFSQLPFAFRTGGVTGMVIDTDGYVGIGTTDPFGKLQIESDTDPNLLVEKAAGQEPRIWFMRARGTLDSPTSVDTGDVLGMITATGYHADSGNYFQYAAGIKFQADGTFGNDDAPGRITFFTTPDGSNTMKERMRIDSSGNVGIGTTLPSHALSVVPQWESPQIVFGRYGSSIGYGSLWADNQGVKIVATSTQGSTTPLGILVQNDTGDVGISTASPGYKLEIGGGDVNTTAGGYRDAGTCVAGTCASDIRLKDNIQELSSSLDKILQLKPSTFEFNDPKYGSTDTNYGLIAQEVEEIFPEWVVESDDGYKKIRYGQNIQMNFLKAFQEHYALTEPLIDSFDISGNQIVAQDFLNATADGLSTKVINDPINGVTDDDFQVSAANLNGAMAIDSANGRLYFRYADNWHYVNQTGGFQIPNYETAPAAQLNSKAKKSKKEALDYESSAYDDYLTEKLMPGDFLIPYVDEYLPDGAVHGLYARFSDVKGKMFKEEQEKLDSLVTLADSNLQSISDLESAIDENFSLVGGRLDELEERLEDLEWQATNNEEAIEGLTTRQGELEAGQTDLAAEQSELAARQSALEALLNGGAESNLGSSGLTENGLEFLPQFLSADDEGVLTLGADTLIQGKLTVNAIETQNIETAEMASQSVVTEDLKLSGNTSGIASIPAGETEIEIKTDKVKEDSFIYFSPKGSTYGKALYVDEIKEGKSFKVKIEEEDDPADEEIIFNWLLLIGQ